MEGGDTFLPRWFFPSRGRPCPGPFSQQVDYVYTLPPLQKATPTPSILQSKEGKGFFFSPPRVQPGAPTPVWVSLDQKRPGEAGLTPRARRGSLFPAGRRVLRRPQVCPARPDPPPEASGVSRQGWGRETTTWRTAIGMSPSPEHFEASRSPPFPEGAPPPHLPTACRHLPFHFLYI